ncbi:MAG: amidohydrolase family protein [Spirosomataceae bacterium]
MKKLLLGLGTTILLVSQACAQNQPKLDDPKMVLGFEEYDPVSTLKVVGHPLTRSKFPFIDVHNHQYDMPSQNLKSLVAEMDKLNMGIMVNLSGRGWTNNIDESTTFFDKALANAKQTNASRLVLFTNIAFDGIDQPGWVERTLKTLEDDVKKGAKGLKIYKNLGFSVKDAKGKLLAVDDPRLDPVWDKCGELGIPVLIHTADPKSFWDPLDRYNERWLELKLHPGRKRGENDYPWEALQQQQQNVFRKHPKTKFIAAHMMWYPNNLPKLDTLLTQMPNVCVEIGAVIAELGRQPRTAKKFFEKYQDRILFGKDSWVPAEYATYFRVLETEDEYFPYHKKYHAFWRMYGLGLSDDVLKKVYYKNAIRLIPGLDASLFPK